MAIPIENVKGIGPASALLLKEAGIESVSELAAAGIDRIAAVKGFSEIRAGKVIESAKTLLETEKKTETAVAASAAETKSAKTSPEKKKKGDKKKKNKKGDQKKGDKKKGDKKKGDKKKKTKKDSKKKKEGKKKSKKKK